MSVREQEQRQRQAKRRIDAAMRKADKEVKGGIRARQQEAARRADEVVRRIEVGDVRPRKLPGVREDSVESMDPMKSMGSMDSAGSIESAETMSGMTEEDESEE